jgi:hypothetical protein
MIFPALLPGMKKRYKGSGQRIQAGEIGTFVEITERTNRRPTTFSGIDPLARRR